MSSEARDTVATDARRAERCAVFLNARCRQSSWVVRQVELANLSTGGCRLMAAADSLELDQDVEIRIGQEVQVSGTVRWLENGDAGIEFDTALDGDQVESLAATYSVQNGNVTDIRRFRRRS